MVKVKLISRDPLEYAQNKTGDGVKAQFNNDPVLHPFQVQREYVRALNSAKYEKMFARPFFAALSGHVDGVNAMSRHPTRQNCIFSGGSDGEIRIWDVAAKIPTWKARAFNGYVRGLVADSTGKLLVACGDNMIKIWGLDSNALTTINEEDDASTIITGDHVFTSIDHKNNSSVFATSGDNIQLWDHNRSKPIRTYKWGVDTVTRVKFNQVEQDILASVMMDRGIFLADSRQNSPLAKLYLKNKSNSLSWNPREAFVFTVANEDHNCYTFDMRNMKTFLLKHTGHFNSVIDIDYSPTGTEFVTGSYDRHIRIFPLEFVELPKSREVYHTTRMNRIFSVLYSADSTFIYSGSDDTNIRLWKNNRSLSVQPLHRKQKEKLDYAEKLKDKFKTFPEIRSIREHRQLSQEAYVAKKKQRVDLLSTKRKRETAEARAPDDEGKKAKIIKKHIQTPILALHK